MTPQPWHGYVLVPALAALGELGLTERWKRGETIDLEKHCAERGLRAEVVLSLADYLVTHGYLARDRATYRHVAGLPELEDGVAKWPLATLFWSYAPLLSGLSGLARGGLSSAAPAPEGGGFLSALFASTHQRVLEHLKTAPAEAVVDVECGDGAFLGKAAAALPGTRLFGLTRGSVPVVDPRCTIVSRDWRSPGGLREVGSNSAWTFFFCLHRLAFSARQEAGRLMRELAARPGTRLIVSEVIRPTDEDLAKYHRQTGVSELVTLQDLSGAGFLSQAAWTSLFEEAGFRVSDVLTSAPRVQGALPTLATFIATAA